MREHWCRVIILACVVLPLCVATAAPAQVRITEVLSDPDSDWDGDGTLDIKLDEWIEITNFGLAPVDLQDHYLRDGTGTAWHYGFEGSLDPGQSLLVTGAASLAWQTANDAGTSGLSLNNSGDLLELWSAPEGGTEILVDSVQIPAHAAASDRAVGWLEASASWILHDGLNPYGGELVPVGTGCMPSPGQANTCNAGVPLTGNSVGRLKAVYED